MKLTLFSILVGLMYVGSCAYAQNIPDLESKTESLITPLVATNNYCGTILVSRNWSLWQGRLR